MAHGEVTYTDRAGTNNGPIQSLDVDSWKHRSQGMRCASCMWYVEKETAPDNPVRSNVGRCRRHAPTMNGYPVVFASDWCGDHRLDENKA